jgi:hypothetical protein
MSDQNQTTISVSPTRDFYGIQLMPAIVLLPELS